MTQAEKFCRLNGICTGGKINSDGICLYCGECIESHKIPCFHDAKSILEVMMKRNDFYRWVAVLNGLSLDEDDCLINNAIAIDYILNPDSLLDEAVRWCEKGESK